jgi:hypothetical protein
VAFREERVIDRATARKRTLSDTQDGPAPEACELSLNSVIPEVPEFASTSLFKLPLEVLYEIWEYMDPASLVKCELVCQAWRQILGPVDGDRFWKPFCDKFFWCPKGGWNSYLELNPRSGLKRTAKDYYREMIECTCCGCGRRTTAFYGLFDELVCLGCRFRVDKYYYYSATEVSALHLTVRGVNEPFDTNSNLEQASDLTGAVKFTQSNTFRGKSTLYRATQIEPIVLDKYGTISGAKKLLSVAKKRPISRNFDSRIERVFGEYEFLSDELDGGNGVSGERSRTLDVES